MLNGEFLVQGTVPSCDSINSKKIKTASNCFTFYTSLDRHEVGDSNFQEILRSFSLFYVSTYNASVINSLSIYSSGFKSRLCLLTSFIRDRNSSVVQ